MSRALTSIACSRLAILRRLFPLAALLLAPGAAWAAGYGELVDALLPLYAVFATLVGVVAAVSHWFRIHELRAELRNTEADLARSAYEWGQAMDFLDDPMYLVDLEDRLVRANRAFYRQIGRTPEDALGLDVRSLIHLKPEKTPCPACAARLEKRDAFFTKEADDPTNPTGRPIEITVRVIRDEKGQPLGVLQGLRDLSHLRAAEEALFREKERAEVTLSAIGDAVLTIDAQGGLNYLNPAAERLLGRDLQTVAGRRYEEVLTLVDEATRRPVADPLAHYLGRTMAERVGEQVLLIDARGHEYAVDITAAPLLGQAGEQAGAVLAIHDVSTIRGVTRQLNYQATHDALTGLINRREFEVRLRQVIDSAQVDDTGHCLIYMDLDRFKVVNDSRGHAAGDALLKEVAALFAGHFRNVDTLARLGGDEFAVLLECCPVATAERIGRELIDKLRAYRLVWDGTRFDVGVSMGLVEINTESGAIAEVMGAADSACYAAKHHGRNRLICFRPDNPEMARHQGQARWVQHITQALETDRFMLYCQAIQRLDELGEPFRHFEILLRMLNEEGELIPPAHFIPVAERYELMPAIDRWVVAKSFAAIKRGGLDRRNGTLWSINLSGQSLSREGFLGFVLAQLDESGIDPRVICFEITETAAVASFNQARKFMAALRERGVNFALDDFGSGLSSFAYLKNLDIDFLKIDGSFVRDMVDDPVNHALVRSIHEVGQSMGIRTIAEFVENDAIIAKLNDLRVDYVQGYGIERPRPMVELMGGEEAQRRAS